MAISHDRLFKELLRTFLWEFLELFVPELTPHLERASLELVEPQVFTDVTAGQSHTVDLVAKVRAHEHEAYLLVHVESQAQSFPDFERRMFRYFARLHENYGLPVFPGGLLSDRAVGRKPTPNRYVVRVPHQTVLDFRYHLIELKRLDWREFLRSENPVAGALMSRMKVAKRDRPLVKAACMRLLAGVPLDPARQRMLTGFVDTYLKLDKKEMERFMLEIQQLDASEEQTIMELTTSWKEEGRREGLEEGLLLTLQARFGERATTLAERLHAVDAKRLNRLKAAILTASWEKVEKLLS